MESLQNAKAQYIAQQNKRAEYEAQIKRLRQITEIACKLYHELEELGSEIEDEDLKERVLEYTQTADTLQSEMYDELNPD